MNVVITTGPSYEPIDEVRRLTNFSTGELGLMIAREFARTGCRATCLIGAAATHPERPENVTLRTFTTNDDLLEQLAALANPGASRVDGLFHVAALCDYKVARVEDAAGSSLQAAKIESRAGRVTLQLEPARKVIRELRGLFPQATIVGWKYELNGSRPEVLEKAWRQLRENHTDACVVNGRAWGAGFGLCTPPSSVLEISDKVALAAFLPRWLRDRRTPKS